MRRFLILFVLACASISAAYADTGRSLALSTGGEVPPAHAEAYEAFGRDLADKLNAGDPTMLNAGFDKEAFLDRALAGIPDSRELDAVRKGMRQGLSRIGESLLQRMNPAYEFTYLRSRMRNGNVALLYRLNLGEEGLNYLELEAVYRDGEIRIVDWYDYATAQRYTDAVRQTLLVMLPLDRGMLDRMLGVNDVDEDAIAKFLELAQLQRERRFGEWLEVYATLPDSLRTARTMVMLRVFNANSSGDEEAYRAALDAAARQFGEDPKLALLLVDHYLYNGRYAEAHGALDNLNRYIGGDTAIDAMRANVYLLSGDDVNALKWAQTAIDAERTYEDAYWTRLEANVALGNFEAAVSDLEILEQRFLYDFDVEALAAIEGYEEFARSEPFRVWARKN